MRVGNALYTAGLLLYILRLLHVLLCTPCDTHMDGLLHTACSRADWKYSFGMEKWTSAH